MTNQACYFNIFIMSWIRILDYFNFHGFSSASFGRKKMKKKSNQAWAIIENGDKNGCVKKMTFSVG